MTDLVETRWLPSDRRASTGTGQRSYPPSKTLLNAVTINPAKEPADTNIAVDKCAPAAR